MWAFSRNVESYCIYCVDNKHANNGISWKSVFRCLDGVWKFWCLLLLLLLLSDDIRSLHGHILTFICFCCIFKKAIQTFEFKHVSPPNSWLTHAPFDCTYKAFLINMSKFVQAILYNTFLQTCSTLQTKV